MTDKCLLIWVRTGAIIQIAALPIGILAEIFDERQTPLFYVSYIVFGIGSSIGWFLLCSLIKEKYHL